MRRMTNLNDSQRRAVATAISRKLTLWQVLPLLQTAGFAGSVAFVHLHSPYAMLQNTCLCQQACLVDLTLLQLIN